MIDKEKLLRDVIGYGRSKKMTSKEADEYLSSIEMKPHMVDIDKVIYLITNPEAKFTVNDISK